MQQVVNNIQNGTDNQLLNSCDIQLYDKIVFKYLAKKSTVTHKLTMGLIKSIEMRVN